jgi:hypothetical protein
VSPVIVPIHPPAMLTIGLKAPLAFRPRPERGTILTVIDAPPEFLAGSVAEIAWVANGMKLTSGARLWA